MLPRQINLDKIQKYLMNIESDIQTNNYCKFYDINIISESFCCDLINKSFELNLENTNLFKRNQKAIDLVDKKSGIAIQITSEKNMAYNFLNYIRKNYVDIFNKIISSLDVEKVKNNMKENYNKIIKDDDKRKNKMIKELKKIANIYKHNSELKCFCDDLIS